MRRLPCALWIGISDARAKPRDNAAYWLIVQALGAVGTTHHNRCAIRGREWSL